ncbi:MAG: cysteine--tRNA ligase [Gammaproteobacteria bacterium]
MLVIFNTLTKQKEVFKPIEDGKVKMYACGMTVYDYCHIGHARGAMITFDMVARYLRWSGYEVTYVQNITDIDDKIIKRAQENNEDYQDLTARFIAAMQEDRKNLGLEPITHEPRATDYIDDMVKLIERLIDKGYAYVANNGDVCYSVRKFKGYGALSHRDLDKLRSGARVEVVSEKNDPLDFVLWKLAKPGEPFWSSPWGEGRPGWHIECSVMSMGMLGETFDIHGGGMDLCFPHHENEIAQSEGATGKKFANLWMHSGYLQINQEKMSKSLKNFITIREALANHPAEVIRYFMLSSHYRSPLDYNEQALFQAKRSLDSLYIALRDLPKAEKPETSEYFDKFKGAMDDDFNTPVAFSILFDLAHEINTQRETALEKAASLGALLKYLAGSIGFLQDSPEAFLQSGADDIDAKWVEEKIAERAQARVEKDWATSDRIRDELQAKNIILEDKAGETLWRRG